MKLTVGHRYLACMNEKDTIEGIEIGTFMPAEILVLESSPSEEFLLIQRKNTDGSDSSKWSKADSWHIIEELNAAEYSTLLNWLRRAAHKYDIRFYINDNEAHRFGIDVSSAEHTHVFRARTLESSILKAMNAIEDLQ